MIGRKINNYEVAALLGAGGMGAVYLARHPLLGRKVAVKILRPEYARETVLVQRFLNEARAANAIRHPNIIDVLDVGTLPDGLPYLFMELLEGEPLSRRIARLGRIPVEEAVAIASEAAAALAAAHAKGIVHRDLKPDNLFLCHDDRAPDGARVKVLDFGVAKLRRELSVGSFQTKAGAVLGTPIYMSPEQGKGLSAEVDHRSDVYALGIILYEMLTGKPPFAAEGFGEMVVLHATEPPRPPRELNPEIPPALEAIILRTLAKKQADRVGSMDELRELLASGPNFRITPPPVVTGPGKIATLPPRQEKAVQVGVPEDAHPEPAANGALLETTAERDDEDESAARPEPAMPRTLPLPASDKPLGTLSFHPNVLDSSSTTVSMRRRKMVMIVAASAALSATALVLALVLRSEAPAAPLPPEQDQPAPAAHSVLRSAPLPIEPPARPTEDPARRTDPVWPALPPAPTVAHDPAGQPVAADPRPEPPPRRPRKVKPVAPRSAAADQPAPRSPSGGEHPAPAVRRPPPAPAQPAPIRRMKKW